MLGVGDSLVVTLQLLIQATKGHFLDSEIGVGILLQTFEVFEFYTEAQLELT